MEHTMNQILLRGTLQGPAEYSHENHGNMFYRFFLDVPRLSGVSDLLPVVCPEAVLGTVGSPGESVTVTGQLRSHNYRSDGKRHLMIFAYASGCFPETADALNECMLEGILCREPVYRRTPLGREICDIMLAVPRSFRRTDYLPCILWGKNAREAALLHTGNRILVTGRFQSRAYTKITEAGTEKKTAYEISALSMVSADQP